MLTDLWAQMHNNKAKKDSPGVLQSLQIRIGDVIADLGSGGGYFTFEFAKIVGKNGKVFAIDTNKQLLDYINRKCKMYKLQNVTTVVGNKSGFTLPIGCDLIFMRNVFHHLTNAVPYLQSIRTNLKANGRIAIIERTPGAKSSFSFHANHGTPVANIYKTMESAGFRHLESHKFLAGQSFNIFKQQL